MANYGLTLVTATTSEPLTLDEAKRQCGIADGVEYHNQHLESLVKAAREKVETDTGRALLSQTWDYTFDLWPCGLEPICLPFAPVSAISSVKYYDTSNVQQTLSTDTYKTLLNREPGEIRLKNAQSWPSVYGETGVITVRFVAGYATQVAVPESLKAAVRLLLGSLFSEEPLNEQAYDSLIAKWRTGDEFHLYGRSFATA